MKFYIGIISLIIVTVGFILFKPTVTTINNDQTIIEVSLNKIKGSEPFYQTLNLNKLLTEIPENLKGIEKFKLDSFKVSVLDLSRYQSIAPNNQKFLYSISGFKSDKQIVITDSNLNLDFSDEQIIAVDNNLRYEVESNKYMIHEIPSIKISDNNNNYFYTRTVPYYGYLQPVRDEKLENYKIVTEYDERYEGFFNLKNKKYKVALNNKSLRGVEVLIAKSHLPFPSVKKYHKYLAYNINDTILLEKNHYNIKSFDTKNNSLVLEKLPENINPVGYRVGEQIDFDYVDIKTQKEANLHQLVASDNDFILLDFWGTWCKPCLELTPDLKRMNTNYSNLKILGIALDRQQDKVEKYIFKKKLNWSHSFQKGIPKSRDKSPKLLEDLRIYKFPTFILINSDGAIVYRGTGNQALKEIEEVIASNQ